MWDWARVQPERPRQVWGKYEVEQGIYPFWKTYEEGEPFGIVNRENMQKYARMGELKPDTAIGVNPLGVSSIEQKFFKGSPYYLSSNLLFTIQERTSSCPGGLTPICVAHGYLLNDKIFSDPFTKGYKKGYTLNLIHNQIITSGTPGTANYGRGYELFFNPIFSSTEIINSQWGMNVVGMQGNLAFCEKGWTACEVFVIVGKDKEEVIEKIQYLVNNYNIAEFIDPKTEIPDIIYNYTMPFKVGNVF